MRYLLIIPGMSTKEWATKEEAEKSLEVCRALGMDDAWIATVPDDEDLDGFAGEGCGY